MTPEQWVLLVPLIIAFVVSVGVGFKNCSRLCKPMGLPKWDFNQSWASNITIAGGIVAIGIVTTILGNLETWWLLPKSAYTYLALFFTALVALAPVFYNFARKVELTNANPPKVKIRGWTWTFLIAATLTVWGAAGQIEIQAGLVMSLWQVGKIPLALMAAIESAFLVTFCLLPLYAWQTMNAAVRSQPTIGAQRSFLAAANQARDQGWPLL